MKKLTPGSTSVLRLTQAANSKYKSLCDQNCLCKEEKEEGTKPGHHNHGVDDKDDNHKGGHQEHEMVTTTKTGAGKSHDQEKCHDQVKVKSVTNSESEKCHKTYSLNDTIEEYSQQLPIISELALSLRLSLVAAASDIEKFFCQIRMSVQTSFLQASLVFKCSKTGLPTFKNQSDNQPNEKQILIPTYCAFGIADLSQAAQAASDQITNVFENYLEADLNHRASAYTTLASVGISADWIKHRTWESDFFSSQCDNALKKQLYIDDHAAYISLHTVALYLHQSSIHNTTNT